MDLLTTLLHLLQALAPVIALAMIGGYGARQKAQGAVSEAAKVDAQAVVVEAAVAQAQAAAPATPLAVVDRLKAGTF